LRSAGRKTTFIGVFDRHKESAMAFAPPPRTQEALEEIGTTNWLVFLHQFLICFLLLLELLFVGQVPMHNRIFLGVLLVEALAIA
jgi:hypothetical protein